MSLISPFPAGVKLLALTVFVALTGCQKNLGTSSTGESLSASVSSQAGTPILREYYITPSLTDPAITTHNDQHFASFIENGTAIKNILVVWLPGSYRNPSTSNGLSKKAASLGFHSIGLMYSNTKTVNPLCKGTNDVTCHRRARLEVVDGVDRHPDMNVSPANSIINRLQKLLVYLNTKYPAQGWGQYLVSGNINWQKIIIAGHSQGGGCAGVIGKYYPVKKVIMVSMIDFMLNGKVPDWELMPLNKEKYYFITNSADEQVPYYYQKLIWDAMGASAYGPRINVDWQAYPYQNTHTLITTLTPNTTLVDKYHNSTAVNSYIPKDASGKYVYDKAWEYLLTK